MAVGKKIGYLATTVLMGSLSVAAFGQAQPGNQPGGNPPGQGGQPGQGGRGNRGNFDPAAMRQRMIQQLQDALGATDEEMTALSPKIDKVMQLQRDARGGGFGFGRGGRGNRGQGGNGGPPPGGATTAQMSPVQKANTDLQTTLSDKDSKPDDIKAKLDALCAARAQSKQDLAAAQQELKGLLTQRQEAVLVERGLLD